jgi:DNA-binding response OmpR family regulator
MARVLVVDDEADILLLVRVNLELHGHDVLLAADGPSALEAVRVERPDLMVLDVMMPGMDGWEVLRRVKGDPDRGVSQVPVIMLTARSGDLDRVRGGIEGAIGYITKPFATAELGDAVNEALEGGPEPVRRRRAQHAALERLARLEKGRSGGAVVQATAPRPHLTRFEAPPVLALGPTPSAPAGGRSVTMLSAKQVRLLTALSRTRTVRDASQQLEVSRSNVYASLRRIARTLDVHSVSELVTLARDGAFDLCR